VVTGVQTCALPIYAPLLAIDDPEAAGVTPAVLMETTLNSSDLVPKVFLFLFTDPITGAVLTRTLYRPVRYPHTPTRPSGWDNRVFCFASDVMPGGLITTVEFPPTAFHRTPLAHVPNTDTMNEAWTNTNPDRASLGPYVDTDADVTEFRSRFACRVPYPYIPIVLGRRLTPREL